MMRIVLLAVTAPRRILAVAALLTAVAGFFGMSAAEHLSAGGFQDPATESSRAARLLSEKFGRSDLQMVFLIGDPNSATGASARAVGQDVVALLKASPAVSEVTSAWTGPSAAVPALVSADGTQGLVVADLVGDQTEAQRNAEDLAGRVAGARGGVTIRAGGAAMAAVQISRQTERDLLLIEAVAIPLSFVALVWVFGGLLAAALPVLVGVAAIAGSAATLRIAASTVEVSALALNVTVAMALALAVDYTLLIISRFRDEVGDGADRAQALHTTMDTAGRTVLFSALTVALSMLALLLFPMPVLKSFGYAGITAVVFAAAAAIGVAPAAIVLLGTRLDALDLRHLLRRAVRRGPPTAQPLRKSMWYQCATQVMRYWLPVGAMIVALMAVVGAPFTEARWGFPDDRVLPASASARQVGDALRFEFAVDPTTDVTIVVPDATGLTPTDYAGYAQQLSRAPDVAAVSSPAGTFVGGVSTGDPVAPTAAAADSAFLTVRSTAKLFSESSDRQLTTLRGIEGPNGKPVLVTGIAQINRDTVASVSSRIPAVLGLITIFTFVVLFVLTGSIVLPIKALFCNILSLTAAFGALVWIFQEGHLGGLGTTATGTLVAVVPVLLFCVAFGLSMDYEVFLVARIREYWLASGRRSADNDESIALGLARTGRVVTAAAILMCISFAAVAAANVSIIRMFGVGLTLAVLMDATLVRMMLVPATMHALGGSNWWAPAPLAHLHARLVGRAPNGESSSSATAAAARASSPE